MRGILKNTCCQNPPTWYDGDRNENGKRPVIQALRFRQRSLSPADMVVTMNKFYLIKFSLISVVFSIVAIVMHLLPSADLLFIKEQENTVPGKTSSGGQRSHRTTGSGSNR